MYSLTFALVIAVFCFKTSDCRPVTNSSDTLKPDVRILVTSFKNESGQCTAETMVDVLQAQKYQIHVKKSSKGDQILTDTSIFVLNSEEPRMVIKPFRPDYTLYDDFGFYKYHLGALKWADARKKCYDEGAHLVIANSQNEVDILVKIMAQFPADYLDKHIPHKDNVLAGFHDQFKEGEYLTIFDTPLAETGYMKWGNGEPSNSDGGENCGTLHYSGFLNDISCNKVATFICEKEIEYEPSKDDIKTI